MFACCAPGISSMARRASTISTNSLAPLKPNVESIQSSSYLSASTPNANSQMRLPPRASSLSGNIVPKQYNDNASLDPDELFTQRTVAEVKAVQLQLRQAVLLVTCVKLPSCSTYGEFPGPMRTLNRRSCDLWSGT